MLLRTTLSVLMLVGCLKTSAVSASSQAYCLTFVRSVATLHQQNRQSRCNLQGSDWTNPTALAAWCSKTHSSSVAAKLNGMKQSIDGCVRCNPYATRSFQQYMLNLRQRCGLTGADWSADQRIHYRWCTQRSKSETDRKIQQRTAALVKCGQIYKQKTCGDHAKQIHQMKLQATRFGCIRSFRSAWNLSIPALIQKCMSAEFGTTLINAYKNESKRCTECYKYGTSMAVLGGLAKRYNCSLQPGLIPSYHIVQCMKEQRYQSHNRLISTRTKTYQCACRAYTNHAMKAAQENRMYRCGLEKSNYGQFGSGSNVWTTHRNQHTDWCMRSLQRNFISIRTAMSMRDSRIAACRKKRP